nr:hypothetical protein [Candidatus Sigynarchaeota archaeon]
MTIMQTPYELDGLYYFICTIPIGVALVVTLQQYVKTRSRHSIFFALAWLSYMVWAILNVFMQAMLSMLATLLIAYSTIPLAFFLILFFDTIAREEADVKKLVVVTFLSMVKIVLALEPDAIFMDHDPRGFDLPTQKAPLLYAGTALMFMIGLLYVYYMVRILRDAPRRSRPYSAMAVAGASLMGIGAPAAVLLNINVIPLFTGAGALLTALAFARQPQLAYVLPFQAHRLMVIENQGGISLFSHTWRAGIKFTEPDLFSSMVQGIRCILQESLQKGNVREIQLDEAVIIIQQCPGVDASCLLVATRSTRSLRNALAVFAGEFHSHFAKALEHPNKVSAFEPASALVKQCFGFIPEYD